MADASILPTHANNKFFFWNAKLTNSLDGSTSATTIYWDTRPSDASGNVTGGFLIAVKNVRRNPNRVELMWCALGDVSADGLSATVVRGLRPSGLDYTTGSSSYVYDFDSGDEVFCAILPQDGELLRSAIQGLIATGGSNFIIGTDADGTTTISRSTGVGTYVGFIRWSTTNDKVEFSNDGSTWNTFDSVTASNLVVVSNNDTTPSNLNAKITVTDGRITKTILNPAGNETLDLTLATTSTTAELNKLTGTSANVTPTNLNTLTAGPASNADALHTHADLGELSYTAYEAISAGNAVALLPVETKWYDQMTDANSNLGNSNTIRKKAVKYIPTASGTLTDWNFRAKEAVNGATALGDLVISIQTDDGDEPSGTAITNATATITQVTQRTWNTTFATRTATFAGSVSVTAGTTYWVVYECSATDATNYLIFGANDSYDENYLTFTQLTYNLDTATWGSSTTTSILFGWSNTTAVPFGRAIVPTDANWGGRTWAFIGFAESAINAQASGTVSTDYATLSGLTPGADYYLSETPGAVTTTATGTVYDGATAPTSFSYKVGKALNSTTMRVQPGPKRIVIVESSLTSTTTRNYLLWFKPDYLRVSATGTGSNDSAISYGYVLPSGANGNVYMDYVNSSAGTAGRSAIDSLQTQGDGTDKFTGVSSNHTDIGFTYTYTEGGTATAYAFIEATA